MATGTIMITNPNGRTGLVKVLTIDSNNDKCPSDNCVGQEVDFVQPNAPGVGSHVVGQLVEAGQSGVVIMINLAVG